MSGWLTTLAAALVAVAATMLALALGQMRGRPALRGSCARAGGACVCAADDRTCHAADRKAEAKAATPC